MHTFTHRSRMLVTMIAMAATTGVTPPESICSGSSSLRTCGRIWMPVAMGSRRRRRP